MFFSPILATKNRLQQPLTIVYDQGSFVVTLRGLGDSSRSLVQPTPKYYFTSRTEFPPTSTLSVVRTQPSPNRETAKYLPPQQASAAATTDAKQYSKQRNISLTDCLRLFLARSSGSTDPVAILLSMQSLRRLLEGLFFAKAGTRSPVWLLNTRDSRKN